MAELSGGVLIAPPAQRFIEGSDLSDEMPADLKAFTNYNRWLFLAAAAFAGAGGEEDEGPPPLAGDGESEAPPPGSSSYDDFAF